jgi:hypothetical protein
MTRKMRKKRMRRSWGKRLIIIDTSLTNDKNKKPD